MDFIKVGKNKLKIMLEAEEMMEYGLDSDTLDYSDKSIRDSFWQILDLAKSACGFDATGEKILIQFYPSKTLGEIFITKLGAISKSAERSIRASERVAMLESKQRIYKFTSMADLLAAKDACAALNDSAVLFRDGNEIYLLTEERGVYSIISEFASELPSALAFYITEHFERIASPS